MPAASDTVSRLLEKDLATQRLRGLRVLVRCDLNVPIQGTLVTDSTRVDASLPTLRLLLEGGARVIVASHLGRPEPGRELAAVMRVRDSLAPVAELLASALGAAFQGLAEDTTGPSARALVGRLQDGQLILLENTRFDARDVADDPALAAELAALADVFVLDGFGVCHRAQASVSGVARCFPPARRFPGPLLRTELHFLGAALDAPVRPFALVLGGFKVRDKLALLHALVAKADVLLIGGRMAFTFLAARGVAVGRTHVELGLLEAARAVEAAAAAAGVRLLLPVDVVVSQSPEAAEALHTVPLTQQCCSAEAPCLPPHAFGLDVGPATSAAFAEALAGCRTILWNGPMGKVEVAPFNKGTQALLAALAAAHAAGATVVAAGGDSLGALHAAGLGACVSHASTGGGAALQLLEGRGMPGLEALLD